MEQDLEEVVDELIDDHAVAVEAYHNGDDSRRLGVVNELVGKVMDETVGQANPARADEKVRERLKARDPGDE